MARPGAPHALQGGLGRLGARLVAKCWSRSAHHVRRSRRVRGALSQVKTAHIWPCRHVCPARTAWSSGPECYMLRTCETPHTTNQPGADSNGATWACQRQYVHAHKTKLEGSKKKVRARRRQGRQVGLRVGRLGVGLPRAWLVPASEPPRGWARRFSSRTPAQHAPRQGGPPAKRQELAAGRARGGVRRRLAAPCSW
jgi:hypothetical protein